MSPHVMVASPARVASPRQLKVYDCDLRTAACFRTCIAIGSSVRTDFDALLTLLLIVWQLSPQRRHGFVDTRGPMRALNAPASPSPSDSGLLPEPLSPVRATPRQLANADSDVGGESAELQATPEELEVLQEAGSTEVSGDGDEVTEVLSQQCAQHVITLDTIASLSLQFSVHLSLQAICNYIEKDRRRKEGRQPSWWRRLKLFVVAVGAALVLLGMPSGWRMRKRLSTGWR